MKRAAAAAVRTTPRATSHPGSAARTSSRRISNVRRVSSAVAIERAVLEVADGPVAHDLLLRAGEPLQLGAQLRAAPVVGPVAATQHQPDVPTWRGTGHGGAGEVGDRGAAHGVAVVHPVHLAGRR